MNMAEAKRMADAGGEEIITPENLGKAAAVAGAAVLGVLGVNKARQGLQKARNKSFTRGMDAYSKTPEYAARMKEAGIDISKKAANPGVQQVDLTGQSRQLTSAVPVQGDPFSTASAEPARSTFEGPRQPAPKAVPQSRELPAADPQKSYMDPETGGRSPNVAEFNEITAGVDRETQSQRQLQEYLKKPLGKMGTPQQRPVDPEVQEYVAARRSQGAPEQRALDFEAGRDQGIREVKEELGGQVLDQLRSKETPSDSFAQGYVRKEGYVDSSPVQTQSTDSMDIDGYQEHREVKRVSPT